MGLLLLVEFLSSLPKRLKSSNEEEREGSV